MCGPSSEQTQIAGQQQSLGTTLQANYNQNYAAQSGILQELNAELSPIAQAGPDQQGFGPEERAALNTETTTGVATNYNKAAQALSMQQRGSVPAGAAQAQQETLATNAAKESAGLNRANTIANYNQGRANFTNATAGVNALAQTYNPTAVAQTAGAGLGNAYQSATTNAQAGAQEFGEIAGGVAALAGAGAQYAQGFQKTPPPVPPQNVNIGNPINMGTFQVPQLTPTELAPTQEDSYGNNDGNI